jgi:hypothetical protein
MRDVSALLLFVVALLSVAVLLMAMPPREVPIIVGPVKVFRNPVADAGSGASVLGERPEVLRQLDVPRLERMHKVGIANRGP